MLARFLTSISSFCFIYALTPLFEFLRYFGFPNTLLWSSFAWLNLWDFVRTFLDRASDCVSGVLLVPIVVLSYAVLILFVRGALGVIGTFLFGFSNRIWGSHSPPSGRLSGPSKYAPAISPSYLHYWYINTYQSRYNLKAAKVLCNVIWTKDAEQTIWYSYCESSGWNRELDLFWILPPFQQIIIRLTFLTTRLIQ